jgi:hypothetical protein
MRAAGSALAAALLLVACGSREESRNGAAEANAAGNAASAEGATADPARPGPTAGPRARSMQPGQWEITSQMTSVEAPGMPPAALAQMRAQLASQRQTQLQCITPEQAANPARNLVGRDAGRQGCQFPSTTFADGLIRISAICRQPGGPASMRMALDGSFTATELNGTLSVEMTGPRTGGGGTQAVRMTGLMAGRRIGDCPPPGARVPVARPGAAPVAPTPAP